MLSNGNAATLDQGTSSASRTKNLKRRMKTNRGESPVVEVTACFENSLLPMSVNSPLNVPLPKLTAHCIATERFNLSYHLFAVRNHSIALTLSSSDPNRPIHIWGKDIGERTPYEKKKERLAELT